MDWYETPQPTGKFTYGPGDSPLSDFIVLEIRPYMHEALMYLVSIHAQVTSAAEPLLDRILSALANELAEEALRCFKQVKRFGMGGMLRVGFSVSHTQAQLVHRN